MKWTVLLLLFTSLYNRANADVVIVSHIVNQHVNLTKQQVRQVYLGKSVNLANNLISQPVSLGKEHQIRRIFNAKVLGLTEARVQSYWAHMRFSGRSLAPKEVEDVMELFEYLQKNQDAIGYVPKETELPSDIVVIYP
ncbi:hypothetical protein [Pseudoalteromonas sp.]|uniref:hypothetical protein n=1 Tax=Pseudoalteromonas sp. TaxID=53249 RepID=UPI00356665E4